MCAALLGCSDESINMGEGVPTVVEPEPPAFSGSCAENPVVEGDIIARSQAEVDALEGCEVINGSLNVVAFEGAHLRSLHALQSVAGVLTIGGYPPYPEEPPQLLVEGGWLASLEGLEALESAGSLMVIGLTAESLAPLANLRTLTDDALELAWVDNLRDLDGLQNLIGVRSLHIRGARRLTSLAGLTLPEYMTTLSFENTDLRQLKPLGVRGLDGLHMFETKIQNLDAFSDLIWLGGLDLATNRRLQSITGLANLEGLGSLNVTYNGALTDVPDFERVSFLQSMRFVVNPVLTKLPSFPNLVQLGTGFLSPEEEIQQRPDLIQLYDMNALTTFTMPAGWSSAAVVRIEHNRNLRQIEFVGQKYIDLLSISDNPLLEQVSTGALDKINVLNVAENPLLPAATFDGVRRLDTTANPSLNAP
jgi:hypothetical protein